LTRPFDKHLDNDELDGLVSLRAQGTPDSERFPDRGLGEALHHVESCEDCNRKVQMHRRVQGEILHLRSPNVANPGVKCPQDVDWLQVAAGLLPESRTRELMLHASQCPYCGPLLRNGVETLSDEATPDEDNFLSNLMSARPEWQKEMVGQLRDSARANRFGKDHQRSWNPLRLWPRPLLVAGALAVLVFAGWLGISKFRTPSAQQLLAQAYTEHRTLELRILGARFAPLRIQRTATESNLDKSSALLKAEALISENLKKNPNDPAWLDAKARADLLDRNYESAIRSLRRALEVEPDSTQLLTDLASAYFERAESADRAIDYSSAIECLGRVLAKSPNDPVALFNRAVVSERMFLYVQAIGDWEHYLQVDPQGEWADDVRKRLATLQKQLKHHEQSQNKPLYTPFEIVQRTPNPLDLRFEINQRIEDYLTIALTDWLPNAYPPTIRSTADTSNFRNAVQILAEVASQKHNDYWLADFLSRTSSQYFPKGIAALAETMRFSKNGDFAAAERHSREAERFFLAAGNSAGAVRAQYETVYALHLMQDGTSCLDAARRADKSLTYHRYPWLQIQLLLEKGTCLWLLGDLGSSRARYRDAVHKTQHAGYKEIYLRAINHLAGADSASGNQALSWAEAKTGLTQYWSDEAAPMQAYNLYFALHEVAEWNRQPYLDVAIWTQAVATIDSTPDVLLRASAHSYLGKAAIAAEKPDLARNELSVASHVFSTAPESQATRVAHAEAESRLAGVELLQGEAVRAVSRLSKVQGEVSTTNDNLLALLFYRTLGEAQFQAGALSEAEGAIHAAVALAELNLNSLQSESDRLRWSQEAGDAYKTLVELKLREGDVQAALEDWEWYRGAHLRSGRKYFPRSYRSLANAGNDYPLPELNVVSAHLPALTGETVVSYAVFADGAQVWVYDDRGILPHWIAIPGRQLATLADHFRDLCSDPDSDVQHLRETARRLYDLLVAPVADRIPADRIVVVEADDALSPVPFEALLDPDGQYLADRVSVISSYGLYYRDVLRSSIPLSASTHALVTVVPAPPDEQYSRLPALVDAEYEGGVVAADFRGSILLQGKEANFRDVVAHLKGAEVFHFAGHAIASKGSSGLLLSDRLLDATSLQRADLSSLQLAVMSACETEDGGDGSSVDADSLVRSFARAGVPHVVASRWKLDSGAARLLMQTFYAQIAAGKTVPRSLQTSEAALRRAPGMNHPYFWAALHEFGWN